MNVSLIPLFNKVFQVSYPHDHCGRIGHYFQVLHGSVKLRYLYNINTDKQRKPTISRRPPRPKKDGPIRNLNSSIDSSTIPRSHSPTLASRHALKDHNMRAFFNALAHRTTTAPEQHQRALQDARDAYHHLQARRKRRRSHPSAPASPRLLHAHLRPVRAARAAAQPPSALLPGRDAVAAAARE